MTGLTTVFLIFSIDFSLLSSFSSGRHFTFSVPRYNCFFGRLRRNSHCFSLLTGCSRVVCLSGRFPLGRFVVLALPFVPLMPVGSRDSKSIASFNIKHTPAAASIELFVAGIPVKCIRHVRGVKRLLYPVCLVESIPIRHSLLLYIIMNS